MYAFNNNDNFEKELFFFGEEIKLQDNYVEYYYAMSYNEIGEIIGIMKISSGSRNETAIPCDTLFTYLLLTGSYSFITIHNHPNNNPEKSDMDILSDDHLSQVSQILNLKYKGGLVITKGLIDEMHKTAWEEEKIRYGDDGSYGESWEEYVKAAEDDFETWVNWVESKE